jgi:cytochrome b involved in lipid metabolism
MGREGLTNSDNASLNSYTMEEVATHTGRDDRWIVVGDYIYNVTNWARRHPGGEKIIAGYAGQNATVSYAFFVAFSTIEYSCGFHLLFGSDSTTAL